MDGSENWIKDVMKNPNKYSGYLIEEFEVEDYETQEVVKNIIKEWAEKCKEYYSKYKIVSTKK